MDILIDILTLHYAYVCLVTSISYRGNEISILLPKGYTHLLHTYLVYVCTYICKLKQQAYLHFYSIHTIEYNRNMHAYIPSCFNMKPK